MSKAAMTAMAEKSLAQSANQSLIKASADKAKRKEVRKGGDYGFSRVMGKEEVEAREQWGAEQAWNRVEKEYSHLGPEIFTLEVKTKR
jgi:hypothetical protein